MIPSSEHIRDLLHHRMESDIQKYGFHIHYVFDLKDGMCNYHTHGIHRTLGHPELQVVIPLDPKTVGGILHDIFRRIRTGEKFEDGKKYDKIIRNFDILFMKVETKPDEAPILRLIIPDAHGVYDSTAALPYGRQTTFNTEEEAARATPAPTAAKPKRYTFKKRNQNPKK